MKQKAKRAPNVLAQRVYDSRAGKLAVSAYLDPGYRRNLRMIQAQTNLTIEAQVAAALNLWFRANGMATVD